MRITFERTGGFAGLRLTTTVDTDTLGAQEASQVRQLVDDAGFFDLPTTIVPDSPQPDRFQYRLTVEDEGKDHSVIVGEAAAPTALRPLIDRMMSAARHRD